MKSLKFRSVTFYLFSINHWHQFCYGRLILLRGKYLQGWTSRMLLIMLLIKDVTSLYLPSGISFSSQPNTVPHTYSFPSLMSLLKLPALHGTPANHLYLSTSYLYPSSQATFSMKPFLIILSQTESLPCLTHTAMTHLWLFCWLPLIPWFCTTSLLKYSSRALWIVLIFSAAANNIWYV